MKPCSFQVVTRLKRPLEQKALKEGNDKAGLERILGGSGQGLLGFMGPPGRLKA